MTDTTTAKPRDRATKPNSMTAYERAGVPPFYADPASHCADLDNPDIMFAVGGPDFVAAMDTCADCPFRQDCHEWAVTYGALYGVWGGVDAPTRRREILRRAKAGADA